MSSKPAMRLSACRYDWVFPRPTLVMGIVNVTPDSFYDGGHHGSASQAIQHALKLVEEGADILDVGGESTRPGATPVPLAEELARVLPVIEALADRVEVPISIDTMKPEVAREALRRGAAMVNDVAAGQVSDVMLRLVAESGAAYVCVHMQGTPETMQRAPAYRNVTNEVADFFRERMERLRSAGIRDEQIILDPGIGFGKQKEHNLQLLATLESFTELGRPIMLGASRKGFISAVAGHEGQDRLAGSLACACRAVEGGVSMVRAHDVAQTIQAIRVTEAIAAAQARDRK